ncbi:hypothetical protein Leryth_006232 [Lithospermum erythrorhizon]|nr:hypothetical protein Leryth_006232 [Lithospermum erythrorhizon]
MKSVTFVALVLCLSAGAALVRAEDPYHFFEWHVTYGTISPLGVPQQVIMINGQYPEEELMARWYRWYHVPYCPWNQLYLQIPGQGSNRPTEEIDVLAGDWYNKGHKALKRILDSGVSIGRPDGIQINGKNVKVGDVAAQPINTVEVGKTYRWNLTASAARPNPQGSYHYGKINITRTIKLANSKAQVDGKLRFAVNGVSHVEPVDGTPLKLLEYFDVKGKFAYNLMKDEPSAAPQITLAPNVVNTTWRNFVEIIFENTEKTIQTWHLDGYSFFPVAIEQGKWSPAKRNNYNLVDAVSRHTIHVYPNSWAAVMTTLDNAGMWNLRSMMTERSYLGQQLYLSSLSPEFSLRDEYNLPETQLLCGEVKNLPRINKYSGF